MKKKFVVKLSNKEQKKLLTSLKVKNLSSYVLRRINVLLSADVKGNKAWTDKQISIEYNVSIRTVEKIRRKYVEFGLERVFYDKKKYHVDLTTQEQEKLRIILSKRSPSSVVVKRAYVLLSADRNGDKQWSDEKIASHYHCTVNTVGNIRQRFVLDGFEAALKGKKSEPNRPKTLTGEVEAKLIALRCGQHPEGYNKWTLRLLANKMVELNYVEGISYESVRKILKKRNQTLAG